MPEGLAGLLFIIPLGLCLGSFATAMIARIPEGRSWIGSKEGAARSACMHCGHTLSVLDLIPLFSWLFLRGRCRYCRAPIGIRYPATECLAVLLCVAVYAVYGWNFAGIVLLLAVPFLVSMIVIDLEHLILPDQLQIILFALGLIFIFALAGAAGLLPALGASLLYGVLAWGLAKGGSLLLKRDALGMGDVKFFAVAGLWLGVTALPVFLMLGGFLGVILGVIWKYALGQDRFPFGPALIVAFIILLFMRTNGLSNVLYSFL